MSLNIINNNSNVNNPEKELDYFTLNKKVYQELILISRPKTILFQIMVHLACKVTYKNGLVGVHSEISKTGLAKDIGINKGDITTYLNQLEKLCFIKIFNIQYIICQFHILIFTTQDISPRRKNTNRRKFIFFFTIIIKN